MLKFSTGGKNHPVPMSSCVWILRFSTDGKKPPGTNVISCLDISKSSPSSLSSLYPSHFSSSHLFLLILSSRRAVTAADELQEPLRPAVAPLLRTPRRLCRRPLKASRKAAREKQAGEVSVRRLAAGVWRLSPPEALPGAAAGSAERRVRVGVEVRVRVRCASLHLVSSLVRPVLLLATWDGANQRCRARAL